MTLNWRNSTLNWPTKTLVGDRKGDEQSVQPEPRAARFLKSTLVGRGPVNRGVRLQRDSTMQHWRLAHAAAVCLILSSATRADEDRVRTTLDAAIAKYDAEAQSVHYSVVKYFDDEEARLRNKAGCTCGLEMV
jgi:anti-sigma-K factor RskA